MRCPCRKKSETISYADCCQPYHAGKRVAPTAEALMRSRYTAYALDDFRYVRATWHPSTMPAHIEATPGQAWMLLRVIAATEEENSASVEFMARSRIGGRMHELHEVSRFVREGGQWLYVDGAIE